VRDGVIAPGARVVAVLTGHLLKDPTIESPNRPIEVEATLAAVEGALRGG